MRLPKLIARLREKLRPVTGSRITGPDGQSFLLVGWTDRGGQVLVCGQRAPAVGRVCMDQMLVDVTEIEDVRPASVVTLIGTDGGQTLRAEEFAAMCGTITNEALTRLSARVPFVWKG